MTMSQPHSISCAMSTSGAVEDPGLRPGLFLAHFDPRARQHAADRAGAVRDVAEHARARWAGGHAGRFQALVQPVPAERALVHRARGLVEVASAVRAGLDAVLAA